MTFAAETLQEDAVVQSADGVATGFRDWWLKSHIQICDKAFDMALFASGASICWMTGAGGIIAAIVPGVIVGGKPVVEALKEWSNKKSSHVVGGGD